MDGGGVGNARGTNRCQGPRHRCRWNREWAWDTCETDVVVVRGTGTIITKDRSAIDYDRSEQVTRRESSRRRVFIVGEGNEEGPSQSSDPPMAARGLIGLMS